MSLKIFKLNLKINSTLFKIKLNYQIINLIKLNKITKLLI